MLRKTCVLTALFCFGSSAAMADSLVFMADLSGDQEVPPVVTATSGNVKFRANKAHTLLTFDLTLTDANAILGGPGAHIHCAPFGVNGPVVVFLAGGVPVGFDGTLRIRGTIRQNSIINGACGATIADLIQSFVSGQAYVNVHSSGNPGGEVRGQIFQVNNR